MESKTTDVSGQNTRTEVFGSPLVGQREDGEISRKRSRQYPDGI